MLGIMMRLKLQQIGISELLDRDAGLCKLLCSTEFGYGHSQIFEVKNCETEAERKLG